MKAVHKIGLIMIGIVIFLLCFFVGLSLGQSTFKLGQFVTGINKWEYAVKEQTVVYYSDNSIMGKIGYQKEYSQDFPDLMKKTVVAVEDRRFYQHNGLDSRGIGRAIWRNLTSGSKSEGGSTITMQLARTLFLGQEKTYTRKIKEVFIASAIEDKYSKDEILNMYLNEIYMGRGCSGMQCAAQSYFNKNVMALNPGEIVALVGMIQAPEYYSPDRNFEGLKQRQSIVVDVLVEQAIITEEEGQQILAQKLYFKPPVTHANQHPYYMAYLSAQLEDMVGAHKLYQGGLKIYTTIDRRMQEAAENAVKKNVRNFAYRGIQAKDAALVSIDPQSAAIKAMVGGVNYQNNQLNMAIIPRQPGSAVKPLYYAAALNEGIVQPDTVLNNKKRDFNGYAPDNYSSKSPDKATVREALVNSYNVASVEVLDQLGTEKAVRYLQTLGITSLQPGDKTLALALGGMEKGISPLQMASAFTVIPAGGVYQKYYTVARVEDEQGKILFSPDSNSKRVINSKTSEGLDAILKDVVRYGTGTPARVSIPSGGKTGTTTDSRDLWYVGYTSEIVTAVWVGNSDGQPVTGYSAYGGSVAGPIWRDYMNTLIYSYVLKEAPPPPKPQPQPEIPEEIDEVEEETDTEEGEEADESQQLQPDGEEPPSEPEGDQNQGLPESESPPAPEDVISQPPPEDGIITEEAQTDDNLSGP